MPDVAVTNTVLELDCATGADELLEHPVNDPMEIKMPSNAIAVRERVAMRLRLNKSNDMGRSIAAKTRGDECIWATCVLLVIVRDVVPDAPSAKVT